MWTRDQKQRKLTFDEPAYTASISGRDMTGVTEDQSQQLRSQKNAQNAYCKSQREEEGACLRGDPPAGKAEEDRDEE